MSDFSERYREVRSTGAGREVALGVLRREGASFLLCIKAIVDVDHATLGDAKSIVHQSQAWSDDRDDREAFWDEVIRLLKTEFPPIGH